MASSSPICPAALRPARPSMRPTTTSSRPRPRYRSVVAVSCDSNFAFAALVFPRAHSRRRLRAGGRAALGHGDPVTPMARAHPLPPIRRGPKIYRTQKLRGTALLLTVAFRLRIKLCFAWGRIAGRARAVARASDRRIMASQACKISRLGLNMQQLREYAPKSIRGTHKTEMSRGSPKPGLQRPNVPGLL